MAIGPIANWVRLERLLASDLCEEFMWMFREAGIEHYKHIVTRDTSGSINTDAVWL